MKEASWAAGGMLAVGDPGNPAMLLPLSRYSRDLYTGFLREIESLSGQSVPFRTKETVQVVEPILGRMPERILSSADAQRLVAGLNTAGRDFILLEEASLDPHDLCVALPVAARAAGITLREGERILSLERDGTQVCPVTARETLHADAFLNCCGAWTSSVEAPGAAMSGITPRKGQMLVVAQPDGPPLTRVLRSSDVYLIPRGDGRIVIGATVENAGYSKQVEDSALLSLRERAAVLWPPAMHAPFLESWAGLRPGSADDLPAIGRYGDTDAPQYVAAGHYRNGILLAPGTAEIIADLITGKTPLLDIAPFAPSRLSAPSICDKRFAAAL